MTFAELMRAQKARLLSSNEDPRGSLHALRTSLAASIATFPPPEFAAAVLCFDVASHLLDQAGSQGRSTPLRPQVVRLIQTCEATTEGQFAELLSLVGQYRPGLSIDPSLLQNGHTHAEVLADPGVYQLAYERGLVSDPGSGEEVSPMPGNEQDPSRRGSGSRPRDGVLSVDEVVDRHYGEWVLMRVTEHDEDHWPSKGHVLAHSPDQRDITRVLEHQAKHAPGPSDELAQPYYSFRAYPIFRAGPEYDTAVAGFVADVTAAKRARSEPTSD